jgi:GTP-binding protein
VKGKTRIPDGPHVYSVALVGRPNVGKSALFNRLSKTRKALVHDRPGMTRDSFSLDLVSESGRRWRLVDTGGLDLDAAGGFNAWTSEMALDAVADADLLVLVLDGADGVLPEDQRIASRLRALGKPVVVAWNKVDRKEAEQGLEQGYELGFADVFGVSAVHGIGTDELLEALEERLPEDLDPETRVEGLPIAIVGRPNVGKSSIVNRIVGAERVMVSEIAGTTRNPVDVLLHRGGKSYVLVDTAGIRRKGKTTDSAELLSVVAARKAMERARIAVIIFDASEGITSQDAHIAGYAEEARRSLVLVANKWDLLADDPVAQKTLRDDVRRRFVFTREAAFLTVSAKTGLGIDKILPEADAVARRSATKLSTGELNRVLKKAFEAQLPKGRSGRELKIRYAVQVASEPPLIRLFSDRDEPLHFSFERYLQNRLRDNWDLAGVPLKFVVRKGE